MVSIRPEQIFECFKSHLNRIIREENMAHLLKMKADFEEDAPTDLIMANNTNLAYFIRTVSWEAVHEALTQHPDVGRKDGRRLVVAPCSVLFDAVLEQLVATFPNISLVDTNRAGLTIAGTLIVHPDSIQPTDQDFCLILTRNADACEDYEQKFGRDRCLNWLRGFILNQRQTLVDTTDAFIARMNASEKPILYVSARPMATLNSTILHMFQNGFSTYWMGSEEVKDAHQTGYATPKVEDVPLTGFHIGGFTDFIYTFVHMERGVVLYHYETIYPPAWDFQRIAVCYAATLAVIRTVKDCRPANSRARLGLYMYDAIKPGVKNYQAGEHCGRLYKQLVSEAEALVYSSYTEAFGDFVENAVGRPLPRVHHHRYQTVPPNRRPRLTDGFHIAVISVLLEDFWEPSRMGLVPYVRDMIAQGLHIHYYCAHNSREKVKLFHETLPVDQRHLFHLHTPIHDLDELANELSQYHVGWSLFNMQIFSDMVSNLTDQFTRDAMDLFTPTTLPSVIWSCAAAGLPIVCNRSMQAVVDLLPPGMTIPLTLSEIHHLRAILEKIDWAEIDRIPLEVLDISNHIHKLYTFLEGYYAD